MLACMPAEAAHKFRTGHLSSAFNFIWSPSKGSPCPVRSCITLHASCSATVLILDK